MTVYLFDMDGTLTPPRLPMTEDFADTFVPWLAHHKAFIATGSDFAKVMEQLPDSVINAFSGIYCAMGNQLRQGHEIVYQKDFKLSDAYPDENIVFMGDRTLPGGNDHELAMALTLLADTETIQVSGPEAVINELNLR